MFSFFKMIHNILAADIFIMHYFLTEYILDITPQKEVDRLVICFLKLYSVLLSIDIISWLNQYYYGYDSCVQIK